MSPDGRIAGIASLQYGAFSAAQARAAGFSRDAVRHRILTGRWRVLARGIYAIAGVPETTEQRVVAAMLPFGSRVVAASRTAAWLTGVFSDPGDLIYLLLPRGQHRALRKGIVISEASLLRSDVRTSRGIRVTCPNRTIVDLAGILSEQGLEKALDDAVLLGQTTVPSLEHYIAKRRLQHRPGMATLRRLLDDRRIGVPQRELEKLFIRRLRSSGLPQPKRQVPCGKWFIDFAYPARRLAVELDGRAYHFDGRSFRDDPRRQNAIVLAGYTVLRFTWDDLASEWPVTESTLRSALGLGVVG
jgi:very-short-patch-repair endonuclease